MLYNPLQQLWPFWTHLAVINLCLVFWCFNGLPPDFDEVYMVPSWPLTFSSLSGCYTQSWSLLNGPQGQWPNEPLRTIIKENKEENLYYRGTIYKGNQQTPLDFYSLFPLLQEIAPEQDWSWTPCLSLLGLSCSVLTGPLCPKCPTSLVSLGAFYLGLHWPGGSYQLCFLSIISAL